MSSGRLAAIPLLGLLAVLAAAQRVPAAALAAAGVISPPAEASPVSAAPAPAKAPPAPTIWTPAAWAGEETLELRTDVPGEGPYWFKVWLVVLDDGVYVRLGSRAARRVEQSASAPWVGVRIGGTEYDRVRLVSVPDRADAVARAMADKYWSDVVVRLFPHPITGRLEPPGSPAE